MNQYFCKVQGTVLMFCPPAVVYCCTRVLFCVFAQANWKCMPPLFFVVFCNPLLLQNYPSLTVCVRRDMLQISRETELEKADRKLIYLHIHLTLVKHEKYKNRPHFVCVSLVVVLQQLSLHGNFSLDR